MIAVCRYSFQFRNLKYNFEYRTGFLNENNIKMPDKTQQMHFIIFNAFLSNFVAIHFFAKKSDFLIQAKI